MRKFAIITALIISLLLGKAFSLPTIQMGKTYPRAFVVEELDYERDMVIVSDAVGMEWEFEEIEDWDVGDVVVAIMNDNGTEIITDDYFVDIRFGGYIFPTCYYGY